MAATHQPNNTIHRTMATSSPLVARSTDGSLIAIHPQNSTSTSKTGLVRCYDGNISNGSLKFTLRFPLSSSSSQDYDDGVPTAALEKKDGLHKLLFASTSYLCGMKQSSSSILIWDLHRGVLASTIDIHDSATDKKKKKKKQRKSSLVATGNEILCDVATEGNQLFALIYFPNNNNDNESGGKCRLYQYNLSSEGSTLVRKIKVGSYNGGTEPQQQQPVFGIGISESTIVVRLGNNHVRIIDIVSGDKLCKIDIPSDGQQSGGGEVVESVESTIFAPLSITRDGSYIVTSINGNQAVVLSYAKGNDDDDKNTKHSLQTLAILSSNKADDSLITSLDITQDKGKDELSVVAFQSTVGISSLFNISTTSTSTTSMVPQLPQATLQTNENDKLLSFIGSSFSSRTPNESLLLLFTQAKHAGGSAAGSGGTNLPMELFSYGSSLEGKVIVGTSLSAAESGDASKDKKRKAVTTALAPGDQGQESSLASDLMMGVGKKKARVSFGGVEAEEGEEGAKVAGGEKGDDFLDVDMSDDDEDGEQAQSIAERLALLSSAMEETDDEDDEDDEDDDEDGKDSKPKKKQFQLKSATSETLTTLLTQALSSNDSSQLNIALQVTDRRLVDGTIRALQSLDAERAASQASADDDGDTKVAATGSVGYIPTLMAHIVRRMARRHSLVMTLGVWVKAILAATARSSSHQLLNEEMNVVEEQMAKDGKDMARKLGPLKNFLNERVECFPQLLRLEGRLSLLNQQL